MSECLIVTVVVAHIGSSHVQRKTADGMDIFKVLLMLFFVDIADV
jgi:hypothetical protein